MSAGSRAILLTIVLASAVGAMTMCLLVIRYGFPAADDSEPEDASRRLVVTRIGHALAGACFAVVAVLATVLVVRPPVTPPAVIATPPPAPAPAPTPTPDTVGRVRAEMEELALRLEERIAALEERTSAAASAGAEARDRVAAAPTSPPAVALPPRPAPGPRPRGVAPPATNGSVLARRTPPPSATAPPATDAPSASPGLASHFTMTTQGLRVELTTVPSRPTAGDTIIYTARLTDGAGHPLIAADVRVEGAAADGATTQVRMEPATEAGVYRGRVAVTGSGPRGLRLRVSHRDARFEVPLPE